MDTFHHFPNLPKELRDKIWKFAVKIPRLVHWRPGGGKAPALFSVCTESRYWAKQAYALCFDDFRRNSCYGMYINSAADTIYAKNDIPDQVKMKNVRLLPANIIVPSPYPGRELNHKVWTRGIKSLIVNLDDAAAADVSLARKQSMWLKIQLMFPELEELSIVSPHVTKHHQLSDLVDINLLDLTLEQIGPITQIRRELVRYQSLPKPRFESLNLRFLKLRDGACQDPDLPMKVPDNPRGEGVRRKPGYVKPARYMRRGGR